MLPIFPTSRIMYRFRFLALSAQIKRSFSEQGYKWANSTQRSASRSYYNSTDKSSKYGKAEELPVCEPVPSQTWKDYIVTPIAILVIAGAGLYLHYNDEKRATHLGSEKSGSYTIDRPAIGGKFKLVDTENRLVTESDLRGNWALMYFGYTSSPDICPIQVQNMAQVIRLLELERNLRITPLFITIDPQRDSPSQLRAYLKEFDPRIIGLTGPVSAVRQVAHEYRVFFKKVDEENEDDYLVESSNNMYLLDPNMETVKYFGTEYDAAQLADGVTNEIKRVSK